MNKVVRHEHVSAAILPESIRGDIPPDAVVTVTVTEEAEIAAPDHGTRQQPIATRDLGDFWRRVDEAKGDRPPVSIEEAVQRVRDLRDEWDD